MCALRLRCKSDSGTHPLKSELYGSSTLKDLKCAITKACGIEPHFQKILIGYPPKAIDLSNCSQTLSYLDISSGVTFTVVDLNREQTNHIQQSMTLKPTMKRYEVPADNSCLFYSVYYALHGQINESTFNLAKKFRADIAKVVLSNPDKYNSAFLGKSTVDYSVWIQCDTSWGGGIELSILSEIFQCEICAIDIQTVRPDNYGQDQHYMQRIFLLYDGIHYDPIFLDPGNMNVPNQTIFSTNDTSAFTQAIKVAQDAHAARKFTDVSKFSLRCITCNKLLTGQAQAQNHAKETGHGNFGEIL